MAMRRYYRWHAIIYNVTRWTFLLGRNRLLDRLPIVDTKEQTLLEVGCGTGRNLLRLASKHRRLRLLGVDVSSDMLARASRPSRKYKRRIQLYERPYPTDALDMKRPADFILFSYALSMFNPGWEEAISSAYEDLPAGGRIAVVDFHDTPNTLFKQWMSKNHVRMEAHLIPLLQSKFKTEHLELRPVFGGLWRCCLFIGVKE